MQKPKRNSFCVTDYPCFVNVVGVGDFSSNEWGLKGFRLPRIDAFTEVCEEYSAVLSLNRDGAMATKAQVKLKQLEAGTACFLFVNLRPVQRISLLSMVTTATVLRLAQSRS